MKLIILFPFVIGIQLISIMHGYSQDPELNFSIKLDKASYKKNAPVNCTMTLKNISDKDIVVNNRYVLNVPSGPHEVCFLIIGPDQKQVELEVKINASDVSRKFRLLHPGESDSRNVELSYYFDLGPKGKYSVTAYYENKDEPPAASKLPGSWKGQLVSNKLSFEQY